MLASRAGSLSLSDLAPGGVYLAAPVARGTGALLPHRFTLTSAGRLATGERGLLSVARAVALRAQPLAGTLPFGARTFLARAGPEARVGRGQTAHTASRHDSTPSRASRDRTCPITGRAHARSARFGTRSRPPERWARPPLEGAPEIRSCVCARVSARFPAFARTVCSRVRAFAFPCVRAFARGCLR